MTKAGSVRGSDLARAIENNLRLYTEPVVAAIREEVDQTGTDIQKGIQSRSPRGRTGAYAKGWAVTKRDTQSKVLRIVHNRTRYMLAHLLEHGHAKRGGGRVEGIPHIAPVAEPRLEQMQQRIRTILENGGK